MTDRFAIKQKAGEGLHLNLCEDGGIVLWLTSPGNDSRNEAPAIRLSPEEAGDIAEALLDMANGSAGLSESDKVLKSLDEFLKDVSPEDLRKKIEEINKLNLGGPTVDEYFENVEKVYGTKFGESPEEVGKKFSVRDELRLSVCPNGNLEVEVEDNNGSSFTELSPKEVGELVHELLAMHNKFYKYPLFADMLKDGKCDDVTIHKGSACGPSIHIPITTSGEQENE